MATAPRPSPPPPPPPATNSSALPFKTNTQSPNPNGAPAQGAPSSTAAAAPPTMSSGPSHLVLCVRSVIGELRACGHLARLEIPDAELTEAGAPSLFHGVLATLLAEARVPGALPSLPMPLMLGDDSQVDLLRLYLAVRSRGGFAAVTCWAVIAEAIGLEPAADAALRLVYAKYLSLLEQTIGKPEKQAEVAGSSRNAAHRSNVKKDKFLSPHKDHASSRSAHLKRKREGLVQMLNWVRLLAKSPVEHRIVGQNPGSQFSLTLMLRRRMFANFNFSKFPYGTTSPQSGLTNEEQAQYDGWDDQLHAGGNSDRILHARARRSGLADVPDWTGKTPLPYDEPHVLRFLGQPLLPPEINEALDTDTIGKGRQDKCSCQLPGSVACVRFHVTEKRIKLKHELGSAFYAMGFDRVGEDAALTWIKDEENKFNAIIQNNLPSSKYRFFEEVFASMGSKGRKGLVSYYHNVFQVRRRAYQNRLTPNDVDSDDDSLEPGFLHLRQGGGQGNSMYASSSGTQRSY